MKFVRHGGLAIVLMLSSALGACGLPLQIEIENGELSLEDTTLTVTSIDRAAFQPVADGWVVDNFTMSGDPRSPSLSAKTGADYEVRYFIDRNEDGKADKQPRIHTYVLRLRHRRTGGNITLRVVPTASTVREMNPDVVADRFVDSLRGTRSGLVQLEGKWFKTREARPLAARVSERYVGTLAGEPAAGVVVELAGAHELLMDSRIVSMKLAMAVAHAPFDVELERGRSADEDLPAIVVATYSNLPRYFDTQLRDFVSFLGRIGFDGRTGTTLPFADNSASAGAAPAAMDALHPEVPPAAPPVAPTPQLPVADAN